MTNQLTKEYIQEVLSREDEIGMHAIGRALVHLLARQTYDEQVAEQTKYHNGVGFTGCDGEIGASMAKFYERRGYLTVKQVKYWQKKIGKKQQTTRIGKYWKQILEVAEQKQKERAAA